MKNFVPMLFAAATLGMPAFAQTMDISGLGSVEDANITGQSGEKIGEIEEFLVDESGNPVAAAIEVGGFLNITSDEVVIMLDDLTYEGGAYTTSLSSGQLESLPAWDD